jgi:hypothetical protein
MVDHGLASQVVACLGFALASASFSAIVGLAPDIEPGKLAAFVGIDGVILTALLLVGRVWAR